MRTLLVCSLLALLSVAVLSKKADIKSRYEKFIKQHINETLSDNKCDYVMQKINEPNKKCKKINTFILDSIERVKAVCVNKGEPDGPMTKSRKRFDIVVCTLQRPKARASKCHYKGEEKCKKIIIKCEKGLPVHYDRDIGHCDN